MAVFNPCGEHIWFVLETMGCHYQPLLPLREFKKICPEQVDLDLICPGQLSCTQSIALDETRVIARGI